MDLGYGLFVFVDFTYTLCQFVCRIFNNQCLGTLVVGLFGWDCSTHEIIVWNGLNL